MNDIIMKGENVEVTHKIVHLAGVSYQIANITSLRVREDINMRIWGVVIGLGGVLVAYSGFTGYWVKWNLVGVGVLALAVGVLMFLYGVFYELILTTGAAEQQALRSRNKSQVTKVGAAINVAISSRR